MPWNAVAERDAGNLRELQTTLSQKLKQISYDEIRMPGVRSIGEPVMVIVRINAFSAGAGLP
jgi:hypothetical protein